MRAYVVCSAIRFPNIYIYIKLVAQFTHMYSVSMLDANIKPSRVGMH